MSTGLVVGLLILAFVAIFGAGIAVGAARQEKTQAERARLARKGASS